MCEHEAQVSHVRKIRSTHGDALLRETSSPLNCRPFLVCMQPGHRTDVVDLKGLKELTRRLPPGSTARRVIEAEPEAMSRDEWSVKAKILITLIHNELGR